MNPASEMQVAVEHHQAGRLAEAERIYRQVLAQQPDHAGALHLLGVLATQLGRFDEAVELMQRAIRLVPDSAEVQYNLGSALQNMGRLDEAIASFRQAIRLKPDLMPTYNNLGNALSMTERFDGAIDVFHQAIRLKPDFAEAHNNLGTALKSVGQLDESIAEFRQATQLKPDYADAHSNLVYALLFHAESDAKMIHEEHRRWSQQHAEPLAKFIRPHTNSRDPDRRLRIGYISADLRTHSVSRFLLSMFREHDQNAYEIICYSDVLKPDGITDRLRACVDGWTNITGWTDERVAEKIREDKIDILVDLAGHTAQNRLRVFARKPAPVQVSYLGYPATTGLSEMDYRLTDSLADPPGETESLHSEKLLRLPMCNWCFSEPDDAPPVGPLPADASGSICFGTFNNFAKASPAVMDLWAKILNAVPSSRLIIKSWGLGEKSVRARIHQFFASRDVQLDRLAIRGHERNIASHFAAYNQVDIALDTFPYHGTTTTCEAMWMGVPVVCMGRQTHVSRVGVSLLRTVGLPELIAQSADEYVAIAVGLAQDLPRLAELRRTLRQRMRASPLMDGPRFAREIEAVYRRIWRIWCAGSGV
jgi:predicted O-linked N-acetylglucosamine transferase (SPINDLY family)